VQLINSEESYRAKIIYVNNKLSFKNYDCADNYKLWIIYTIRTRLCRKYQE
jgi:hypothetical protein